MLVILLGVFAYLICFILLAITHSFLGFMFGGDFIIPRTILEFCVSVFLGLMFGKFLARKILYIQLKNSYKNKQTKKKGEQK